MVTVSLGPDVADAAKDAVRRTRDDLIQTCGRWDGLPYKAAYDLYQISHCKITHDEAWTAIQEAIREMERDGEFNAPTGHYHGGSWSSMSDKIDVVKTIDEEGREKYTVCASSLLDLANLLGVTEEQFVVKEDDKLTRQRRLQELNRQANTPEAIRKRTDFNPWTGRPDC